MRAAMVRAAAYFGPASAPWALLPLVVREQLAPGRRHVRLAAGADGRGRCHARACCCRRRGTDLRAATRAFSPRFVRARGMAVLALSRHWLPAAVAMLVFGVGWVAASSVAQGAAQLAAPPWVRSRALALYQLSSNGGIVVGSFFWGWLGTEVGLPDDHAGRAGAQRSAVGSSPGISTSMPSRPLPLPARRCRRRPRTWRPNSPSAMTARAAGSVNRSTTASTPAGSRSFSRPWPRCATCAAAAARSIWQLYEDVAHPDGWLEVWSVESWTDHLREAARMSEADRTTLAGRSPSTSANRRRRAAIWRCRRTG